LLEAFKAIDSTQVVLCFLGEPTKNEGNDYQNAMYRFIEENNLQKRVFIRPFRKDIVTFYKAVDACIMASKAETVGMVTLESLASGTPVIGSNAGGTPEILENGKFGLLFETQNADSLAEAITDFINNPTQFNSVDLQKESEKYDHTLVCEKVLQIG
jgi:glycosyltransferase involved in cell wall biosynthesis